MTSDPEEPLLDPISTKEAPIDSVSTKETSLDPVVIKELSLNPIPTKSNRDTPTLCGHTPPVVQSLHRKSLQSTKLRMI